MFWLKACHRCGGDVYKGSDIYGEYFACIQCGAYISEDDTARLRASPARLNEPKLEDASSQKLAA